MQCGISAGHEPFWGNTRDGRTALHHHPPRRRRRRCFSADVPKEGVSVHSPLRFTSKRRHTSPSPLLARSPARFRGTPRTAGDDQPPPKAPRGSLSEQRVHHLRASTDHDGTIVVTVRTGDGPRGRRMIRGTGSEDRRLRDAIRTTRPNSRDKNARPRDETRSCVLCGPPGCRNGCVATLADGGW